MIPKGVLALGLVLFWVGCGGGSDSSGIGLENQSSQNHVCDEIDEPVSVEGVWAVRALLDVRGVANEQAAVIALCPDPQVGVAEVFLKIAVSESEDSSQYRFDASFCSVDLPLVSASLGDCSAGTEAVFELSFALGPEFQAYLPSISVPGTFSERQELGRTVVDSEAFGFVGGATLAESLASDLPSWEVRDGCKDLQAESASCVENYDSVFDEDGDGKPGVTIQMSSDLGAESLGGDAYTVFRLAPTLSGAFANNDCIEGQAASSLEYSLVDSDVKVSRDFRLSTALTIQNIPQLSVLDTSTFRALRADGAGEHDFDDNNDGTVDCVEISRRAGLFLR